MATIQHNTLGDSELHEPKGVDSADKGTAYIADGTGTGSWKQVSNGWGFYDDASAAQSIGTSPTKLTINGLGSNTNETKLPDELTGSDSLWDTTNSKITPTRNGDAYMLRLDLPVSAKSGSPATLTIQLDIGGTASPTIVVVERDVSTSKAAPYSLSVAFPIFCLSTFLTNGGQFFLNTDTGTVDIDDPAILIVKLYDGGL